MYDLSKIGERLKELVGENELTVASICKDIGISKVDFYRWWSNSSVPTLKHLVLLADYFDCSIDFVIGRSNDDRSFDFYKTLPPFSTQLRKAINESGKSIYQVAKETKIHEQAFTRWLNGKYVPLLDNLLKIANALDCSLDHLIGRE